MTSKVLIGKISIAFPLKCFLLIQQKSWQTALCWGPSPSFNVLVSGAAAAAAAATAAAAAAAAAARQSRKK